MNNQGLFTWSGGPRSSGVGFFCFHALGDTKQKKLTPLDRGSPTPCKQGLNQLMLLRALLIVIFGILKFRPYLRGTLLNLLKPISLDQCQQLLRITKNKAFNKRFYIKIFEIQVATFWIFANFSNFVAFYIPVLQLSHFNYRVVAKSRQEPVCQAATPPSHPQPAHIKLDTRLRTSTATRCFERLNFTRVCTFFFFRKRDQDDCEFRIKWDAL